MDGCDSSVQIFNLIKRRRWKDAETLLWNHPSVGSTWVGLGGEESKKILPIHYIPLCWKAETTSGEASEILSLIETLVYIYPEGIRTPDYAGDYPLNLALWSKGSAPIISKLLQLYPDAKDFKDSRGNIPKEYMSYLSPLKLNTFSSLPIDSMVRDALDSPMNSIEGAEKTYGNESKVDSLNISSDYMTGENSIEFDFQKKLSLILSKRGKQNEEKDNLTTEETKAVKCNITSQGFSFQNSNSRREHVKRWSEINPEKSNGALAMHKSEAYPTISFLTKILDEFGIEINKTDPAETIGCFEVHPKNPITKSNNPTLNSHDTLIVKDIEKQKIQFKSELMGNETSTLELKFQKENEDLKRQVNDLNRMLFAKNSMIRKNAQEKEQNKKIIDDLKKQLKESSEKTEYVINILERSIKAENIMEGKMINELNKKDTMISYLDAQLDEADTKLKELKNIIVKIIVHNSSNHQI